MKSVFGILILFLAFGCTSTIPRKNTVGKDFPQVKGKALNGQPWMIPKDMAGENVLLLVGYKQNSQFDIDRWLIGIDQKGYKLKVFEVPTVQGWFPSLIAERIDEGMRSGIPEELWKIVITVYDEADKITNFTGNENGRNARVIVLDKNGKVLYMHDRGFSVAALNKLGDYFPIVGRPECQ